jgi:hypothetical protein
VQAGKRFPQSLSKLSIQMFRQGARLDEGRNTRAGFILRKIRIGLDGDGAGKVVEALESRAMSEQRSSMKARQVSGSPRVRRLPCPLVIPLGFEGFRNELDIFDRAAQIRRQSPQ